MNHVRQLIMSLVFLAITLICCKESKRDADYMVVSNQTTICNPLDISYRFSVDDGPSRREAADPTVVFYKDDYYLFASKSGGYWSSKDLIEKNSSMLCEDS